MPLSDRQSAAAHRLGQDVCVVAGPGSGKTSVLIERFSWLVREQGVSPREILAITFTEKAATEIRQRMLKAFSDRPDLRSEIERAWVSTIHAFCARLLRENAIEAGIDPAFGVLEQAYIVLREVADDVLQSMFDDSAGRMRKFLRSLAVSSTQGGYVPDLATSLVEVYQAVRLAGASLDDLLAKAAVPWGAMSRLREICREIRADRPAINTPLQRENHDVLDEWVAAVLALDPENVTEAHLHAAHTRRWTKGKLVRKCVAAQRADEIAELAKQLVSEFYAPEREWIVAALKGIDAEYRSRKRAGSLLDFDDLEEAAIELLKRDPELRGRVQQKFQYILMDELQDTNPLQWALMELVRKPDSFFAVGDINQSIYGFRHAEPELFAGYRKGLEDRGLAIDELRDNYRTRPQVLDVVNRVFEGAPGIDPHQLIAGAQFDPPPEPECVKVICAHGQATEETESVEARWVAARIREIVDAGQARYGDIAILTRANYSTGAIQTALDLHGVPSIVVGGQTFYETREALDLKLALDALLNPEDEFALAGLLRSPLFGLSDEELLDRRVRHHSLRESMVKDPPQAWEEMVELRRLRNQVSPDRLLRRLLDACDYDSGLTDRGRANIDKYLTILRERWEREPMPLAALVEAMEQAQPEAEAPPADFGDAVRLMTMHKAKGLEFPVVFLPYLHKGRNRTMPVISYSHRHGLGVRWRSPVDGSNISDASASANQQDADAATAAEENRLLYVGMTRAKQRLVLSWSVVERDLGSWNRLIAQRLGFDPRAQGEVGAEGIRYFHADQAPATASADRSEASRQPLVTLDRIDWRDHAESAASVTDVSQFGDCPRKFYLGRFLGAQPRPSRELLTIEDEDLRANEVDNAEPGGRELGVMVHALLAGAPVPDPAPEALELVARYQASPLYAEYKSARRASHEWDFVLEQSGLVLRGQIDLWFESRRGEIVIVDFKTDRQLSGNSLHGYSLQCQIYAQALFCHLGVAPARGILFHLRSGREYEVDMSPLAIGAAREEVARFSEALSGRNFPLRSGSHCFSCDFLGGTCPVQQVDTVSTAS